MATLRNKTTDEGVIVIWNSYPDHGRPSTYQVTDEAVSFLEDIGFSVPHPGNESEIPWDVCRPLRVLGDLYFKKSSSDSIEISDIGSVGESFAESLTESQRQRLEAYISSHNNYRENSEDLAGELSSLPSNSSDSNNNIVDKTELQEGDEFTAEVDRISGSGNGMIVANKGHITVGPLKRDADGEEIRVELVTEFFGICVTPSVRADDYTTSFWRLFSDNFYKYGRDTIDSAMFCEDCGCVALIHEDTWICGTCGSEFRESDPDNIGARSDGQKLPTTGDTLQNVSVELDSKGNICSSEDNRIKINGDVNLNGTANIKIASRRDGYVVGRVTNFFEQEADRDPSINELRSKAQEAATEEVSTNVTESTSKTVSYSRSPEVREYVKARADGICEGCAEPAPFTSTTGEPYLQTHHIHELSDGGSDTPENVAALCPNCHYRIHHGEDGEEYNNNLLTKIQAIEDDMK